MKRILALALAATMMFGLVACGDSGSSSSTPADSGARKIVYAFPGTAARLNIVNDDGSFDGYEIAIIKELDKRLEDYEFELFCAGEFSALTPGLDSDKFDMVGSNITWKQERADNYLYSEVSYYSSPYVIGVAKDNTSVNGLADLAGKHVLTITGTATAIFLETYNAANPGKEIILDYIDAGAQECISQVVTGRYDACIQNKADFAIAKEEHGYDLRLVEIPNSNEISLPDGYFLFDKEETELQAAVDAELQAMKDSGELTNICLQYFTMDLVPKY